MVEDQEVAKLVCSVPVDSGNGVIAQPATVCLLGEDLDKYPWLNTKFYEREIPAEYASRQILYFPAIATDPQHQGEHKTADVVNLIAQMVEYGNNEIVVAFDCCDFNKDVFPLAAVLEDLINATPEANIAVKKSANIWATKDVNAVSICAVPTGFKDAAMVIKKESCPNICNDAAVLKDNIPAVTADGANYNADANIKGKSAADIDGSALKIVSEENNQANHCIMTPSIQLE
jgi:hypothetical protein